MERYSLFVKKKLFDSLACISYFPRSSWRPLRQSHRLGSLLETKRHQKHAGVLLDGLVVQKHRITESVIQLH